MAKWMYQFHSNGEGDAVGGELNVMQPNCYDHFRVVAVTNVHFTCILFIASAYGCCCCCRRHNVAPFFWNRKSNVKTKENQVLETQIAETELDFRLKTKCIYPKT